VSDAVIWHDLECGAYRADLPFWRELAHEHAAGPVLDIGAGTGRVAVDLAGTGQPVIALERDGELAAELRRRAAGLPITVLELDACAFELPQPVALCIVPMQTVHLFEDRVAFLACARRALLPGGLLALALLGADVLPFELELRPDVLDHDGRRYASTPTALRLDAGRVVLERRRTVSGSATSPASSLDVIALAQLDPGTLTIEAEQAGFSAVGLHAIAPTDDHSGSDVLLLARS